MGHSKKPVPLPKGGYRLQRYNLSLSSFAGLVATASHWWCRVHWTTEDGEDHEADAQCMDQEYKGERTGRFNTKARARAAGIRLAHRLAERDGHTYHVIVEGHAHMDPMPCLSAPGNLRKRLNDLWRRYEKLDGWEAPRDRWPEVQEVCDRWDALIKGP